MKYINGSCCLLAKAKAFGIRRDTEVLTDAAMGIGEEKTEIFKLVLHRFNEADKWFACASFENAMQTDQARKMHFRPHL